MKRTRDVTNAQRRISERNAGKQDCTWYGEAYCHGDEVIVSYKINPVYLCIFILDFVGFVQMVVQDGLFQW